jgi:DNA-binding beta-propeller fold protein YncE
MRLVRLLLPLLAAATALIGCGSSAGDSPRRLHPARGPVGLLAAGRLLYAADAKGDTVLALDASTGHVRGRFRVNATPLRLAATPHAVWSTNFRAGTVSRIDLRSRTMTAIPVGSQPEGIAAGAGAVWVVRQDARQLLRLDPRTGRVTGRVRVGDTPRLAAFAFGHVWVADYDGGSLLEVDPRGPDVVGTVHACDGPQGMAVAAGRLWVACTRGDELVAVDPAAVRVVAHVRVVGAPDGLVASGGQLYAALDDGPTLVVVDPKARKVLRRTRLGHGFLNDANVDVAVTGGRAWVSFMDSGTLFSAPA